MPSLKPLLLSALALALVACTASAQNDSAVVRRKSVGRILGVFEAIVYYRLAEMPMEFRMTSMGNCGALLLYNRVR